MPWTVLLHPEFDPEFEALPEDVQDKLMARARLLQQFGPQLGRPHVDTLGGSAFSNMKELRFEYEGVWRFAFAFDPRREAIILCGGDKEGRNQRAFYSELISKADRRFAAHITSLKKRSKT